MNAADRKVQQNDLELDFLNLLPEQNTGRDLTYSEIWSLQKIRIDQIAKGEAKEAIIFCEHEPSITLGRRAKEGNILDPNIPRYEIERGGDVTYHGRGQLVIYPLLNLHAGNFPGGLHEYLRFCEQIVIDLLNELGLDAGRFGPTGVWVRSRHFSSKENVRKIASIGVAVRRWITYHGISLNVNMDLTEFTRIRPCDFEASIMTSLANEGVSIELLECAKRLEAIIRNKLDHRILSLS